MLTIAIAFEPGLTLVSGRFWIGEPFDSQPHVLTGTATLSDPWGNVHGTQLGSKPEYGPGGFAFLLAEPGLYSLTTSDARFQVPVLEGYATHLTLYDACGFWPRLMGKLDRITALLAGGAP